jgi:hypothetical protein
MIFWRYVPMVVSFLPDPTQGTVSPVPDMHTILASRHGSVHERAGKSSRPGTAPQGTRRALFRGRGRAGSSPTTWITGRFGPGRSVFMSPPPLRRPATRGGGRARVPGRSSMLQSSGSHRPATHPRGVQAFRHRTGAAAPRTEASVHRKAPVTDSNSFADTLSRSGKRSTTFSRSPGVPVVFFPP